MAEWHVSFCKDQNVFQLNLHFGKCHYLYVIKYANFVRKKTAKCVILFLKNLPTTVISLPSFPSKVFCVSVKNKHKFITTLYCIWKQSNKYGIANITQSWSDLRNYLMLKDIFS